MTIHDPLCRGLIAAAVLSFAVGCSKQEPAEPDWASPDQTHTVCGRVVSLPAGGKPLMVSHEAIPDWVYPSGKKGMNAMEMPFPMLPACSLEGLEPGDAVEMTVVVVNTAPSPNWRLKAVRELPADTALKLAEPVR